MKKKKRITLYKLCLVCLMFFTFLLVGQFIKETIYLIIFQETISLEFLGEFYMQYYLIIIGIIIGLGFLLNSKEGIGA